MDLVISDIHADISALKTIIILTTSLDFQKKYGKISRIINLGDVLERGVNPKQVLEKLMSLSETYPIISVMGNHDEAFLYGRKVSYDSLESISAHDSLTIKDLEFFKKNQDETYGQQDYFDKKIIWFVFTEVLWILKRSLQKIHFLKNGYIRKVGRDYLKKRNFLAPMGITTLHHLLLLKQKIK